MPTNANITIREVDGHDYISVISVSGELDESNLNELENGLSSVILDLNKTIVIFDLSDLIFMSSKIIGYLASLYSTLNHSNRKMILASYNENISDILKLVGLDKLIPSYLDLNDALEDSLNSLTNNS